jgi:GDP-L-fucose synthase
VATTTLYSGEAGMNKQDKIYVAGHHGMVGSAMVRCLNENGYENLIFRSSKELDLTRQSDVEHFFTDEKPDYVFIAAARVGGIMANKTYRAEFIYTNLQIQNNIIHASWQVEVKKLLFFSSSCVYPRLCPQPMKEEHLWAGALEPTNKPYAVAKLAGMSMCKAYNEQYNTNFISVIPTNLYGPNDNYDPQQSHVMAALIHKFHVAKINNDVNVILWGTGSPKRELLYVDDAVNAALFVMEHYSDNEPINVGLGEDQTISELANLVSKIVGYQGEVIFDTNKPDGVPQKLLDVTRLHSIGWKNRTSLEEGIMKAYEWYLQSFLKKGN